MNRRDRRAARAQAFNQDKPKRGRPAGARPLRYSEMGRETAVFGMLVRTRLRHSPVHAAEFAASVFNKSVEVTEIEGGLCFEYTGGLGVIVNTIRRIGEPRRHDPKDRDNALKNRRDKILREAPRLIRNATGKDREWLEVSMLTLDSVFNALALGDDEALQMSFAILRRIGWHVSTSPIQKFISEKATRSDR